MKKWIFLTATTLSTVLSCNAHADNSATPSPSKRLSPAAWTHPSNPPAPPPEGLSGNFDLTSNYLYRGITSSANMPAVQGGFTYTFSPTGLYFNLWGSNVNFRDTQGNTATLEIDTIMGIANHLGEHFSYNVLIDRYNYPKSSASYAEIIGNMQWHYLTGLIAYSGNTSGTHHPGTYYNLGFTWDIPEKWLLNTSNVILSGGIGHFALPRDGGLSSYNDYNLQLAKTIDRYVLSLRFSTTSNSRFKLANDPNHGEYGPHFIWTALVNF